MSSMDVMDDMGMGCSPKPLGFMPLETVMGTNSDAGGCSCGGASSCGCSCDCESGSSCESGCNEGLDGGRLLLVDGSNLMFQMFYGMPSRIVNDDGVAIHGVLGFVGAFLKIVGMVKPTHVLVLFDGEHENPRCQMDAQYKANRDDYSTMALEETPFSQMPYIYDALDFMGVPRLETVDCEADDLVASYSKGFSHAGGHVTIASMDSDFFQLVSDGVDVLRYRGKNSILCDVGYVSGRFGVPPELYCDYKSLVGDPSDNIKGVPGIGPKTACRLLVKYGSLDGVVSRCNEIEPERIGRAVRGNLERLGTNRRLILLDGSQPLPIGFARLRVGEGLSSGLSNGGFSTRNVLKCVGLLA